MNNEPVAWMVRRDDSITKGYGKEIQLTLMDATKPEFWVKGKIAKGYEVFPLYTHPHSEESVKAKTLTDEEIAEVYHHTIENYPADNVLMDFARAILRKAQEK